MNRFTLRGDAEDLLEERVAQGVLHITYRSERTGYIFAESELDRKALQERLPGYDVRPQKTYRIDDDTNT